MSADNSDPRPNNFSKMPRFVLRKDKLMNLTIIKPANSDLLKKFKTYAMPFREEVIYQSVLGDFLNLVNQKVTIVNRQHVATKSIHTVARFEENGRVVKELTSENITNLIGKEKYEFVFSTLCSVFSQELKIRSILALLTIPKKSEVASSENDNIASKNLKVMKETAVQTEELSFDIMMKSQPRRRVKRQQPTPYVVTDAPEKVNRVVISPSEFKKFSSIEDMAIQPAQTSVIKNESVTTDTKSDVTPSEVCSTNTDLPELPKNLHLDEDSKDSFSGISLASFKTTSELMHSPFSLVIDKLTEKPPQPDWTNITRLKMLDGTEIAVPVKPEDDFHVATPEILKYVEPENRRKLLCYQLYLDWKLCLRRNEDDYLAIHTAVINNDVDLVRRQCLVLKSKEESVDIPTGDNMSALQISITRGSPECTAMLLHFGADPLATDEEYRTCFHLAAEAPHGHMKALIEYCQKNPLRVLEENEELWKPELVSKPQEYQVSYLLHEICSIYDNQGDTPLMVASRLGCHENVELLLKAAPRTVDLKMPNSGNTALFRAVGSACHDSTNRGNKSKISEKFKRTIELLVENGANPTITNHSGYDVNALLADFSISELSLIIAAKLTYLNTRDTGKSTHEPLMLIKEEDGTVNTVDIKQQMKRKDSRAGKEKLTDVKKPAKNVRQMKNTTKNVKNTKNNDKISKTIEADNNTNTVQVANTSKQDRIPVVKCHDADDVAGDGQKLIILENKLIRTNESSQPNQYLNHYKSFVASQRPFESIRSDILKRKANEAFSPKSTNPNAAADHPRVKTLRKINPKLPQNILNSAVSEKNKEMAVIEDLVSNRIKIGSSPAKRVKCISASKSDGKMVVIENKPSTSKVLNFQL